MDLRITNTCNNNCLYCLEQSLREKERFLGVQSIKKELERIRQREKIISFYGGNSLLHPDIIDIISYCWSLKFDSISILTNSHQSNPCLLSELIDSGLTGISMYFHSCNPKIHEAVVNGWIWLQDLYENIEAASKSSLHLKITIHVHSLNIWSLSRDIIFLYKKYKIDTLEFVNYFPFDRPHDKYHTFLWYDSKKERQKIISLFHVLEYLKITPKFYKFPASFFGEYMHFYSYEDGIKKQISKEDKERINMQWEPICFTENRCPHCFIQDNCPWYGERRSR